MGRKRIRLEPNPTDGIARGVLQRAVLSRLLAGDVITVPASGRGRVRRPPAGMTRLAWTAFQRRLKLRGYQLEWAPNDYASALFDTYRLTRLFDYPNPDSIV